MNPQPSSIPFCQGPLLNDVIGLLERELFAHRVELAPLYAGMVEHFDGEKKHLLRRAVEVDETAFGEFLSAKGRLLNLGIDLPIWFGDHDRAEKRTMIVAMDPKRNDQSGRRISLGSVFSFHNKADRDTNRNDYWRYIHPLIPGSFAYLTDIYKLYYEADQVADGRTVRIPSNKDKGFIGAGTEPYAANRRILTKEIEFVRPHRIIAFGNEPARALKEMQGITEQGLAVTVNGIEYLFIPHISRTVTQSITTIANLYTATGILRGNEDLKRIGREIQAHREALYGG